MLASGSGVFAELTIRVKRPLPNKDDLRDALTSHFQGAMDIREAFQQTEYKDRYDDFRTSSVFAYLAYQTLGLVFWSSPKTLKVHLKTIDTLQTLGTLKRSVREQVQEMEQFFKNNGNSVNNLEIVIWAEKQEAQWGQRLYWQDRLMKHATEDWFSKMYVPSATFLATVGVDFFVGDDKDWINLPQAGLNAGVAIIALVIFIFVKATVRPNKYTYRDSGAGDSG